MRDDELTVVETELLLETLWRRYGYDFRDYARASLRRRIAQVKEALGYERVGDMIAPLLYDEALLPKVVDRISVSVSEFFRDPDSFGRMREEVFSILASYPRINIWHAGCGNGEEVYSLAILLEEAGLYDRCQLYATDLSETSLSAAEAGIYPLEALEDTEAAYRSAGGENGLADYYRVEGGQALVDAALRRNILFAQHNLVSDGVFCEAHLVVCRNVFIYFNRSLQERVLELFRETLVRGGFLWLGTKERPDFSAPPETFGTVDQQHRLYRKHPAGALHRRGESGGAEGDRRIR